MEKPIEGGSRWVSALVLSEPECLREVEPRVKVRRRAEFGGSATVALSAGGLEQAVAKSSLVIGWDDPMDVTVSTKCGAAKRSSGLRSKLRDRGRRAEG